MVQRVMADMAATVVVCAVGAALLQLAAEIVSFPAPIAVTQITLMAAAALHWLAVRATASPATACRAMT